MHDLWAWIIFGLLIGFGYIVLQWVLEEADPELEEIERQEAALEALRRMT